MIWGGRKVDITPTLTLTGSVEAAGNSGVTQITLVVAAVEAEVVVEDVEANLFCSIVCIINSELIVIYC